jgi:hypothetical protein
MSRGEKERDESQISEEGQALLEFAFVAVFMVLVIFAVMDFARLFFAYATMANGAREGARYGIIHPGDDTGIEERARAMMVLIGAEGNVTINYPGEDSGADPGCTRPHLCRIQVVITTTLDVWTPVLPSIPIVAQATMHFE